jgi:hypothetical protein
MDSLGGLMKDYFIVYYGHIV